MRWRCQVIKPVGYPAIECRCPIGDNASAFGLPESLPKSTINPNRYRDPVADPAAFGSANVSGRHVLPGLPCGQAKVGDLFCGNVRDLA